MRQALKSHPDFQGAAVSHIDVDVVRTQNALALRYIVSGNIAAIRLPPRVEPARTDELWKHTCFELFVRRRPSPTPAQKGGAKQNDSPSLLGRGQGEGVNLAQRLPYLEFNFSPSTQWAAYSFTAYREGMSSLENITAPKIQTRITDNSCELSADLDLKTFSLPAGSRLGLSAVIEEMSGARSFWAIAHPVGKPDFHHSDCFALTL